ncbi:ABC transporter ATP-binding protein [Winogradskyella sp.]|uniref:ABC transporter ATP-binding protein n=1 Tax=Winogradskyella sp. TaxID=1883156 RepID=UPI00260A8095|nr:ATP-binding cassette domain-containing protein [Winogradskyella sp.]
MSLDIQHIAKSFGDKSVLEDVSFQLEKGKVAVLMGANGSGKTTLFNIITGFLKADYGKILLHNELIDKLSPHRRNTKGISRTFQDMRLIGELSVLDNVILAFQNQSGEQWWKVLFPIRSITNEQDTNKGKAERILNDCFIADVAESKANEISYGQQKLLNLACCIANNAEVILLDEPVAGVNPLYHKKLELIVKVLKKEKILLIIEHNTDFIQAVADEILFLNGGTITKFVDYATMRNNKAVLNAYI